MDLESFQFQFRNFFKELPKICLLGVRGCIRGVPSDLYDDTIYRFIEGELKEFTASVDPGKFYINHPMNPKGCARLQCGMWKYQIGEHHNHPALVQSDEVKVDRLDYSGRKTGEESGWFGVNLHSGGAEYLIGRYSAGCQIIKTSEPWKREWLDFFTPISAAVEMSGQKEIPYLLIDRLEAIPLSEA